MAFINVVKLEKLFFRCHKILPLVYDESLSYYEVLCKVACSLNETIDAVNALNDNVVELNGRVNILQEEVEAIAKEINKFEQDMNAKFDILEAQIYAKVDAKLAEVDVRMDEMESEINQFKSMLEISLQEFETHINKLITDELAIIDYKFNSLENNLKAYIYTELQKALDKIPKITNVTIYDPTTGRLGDIQDVIYHMFDIYRYNYVLNCQEIDNLQLTCNDWMHINVNGVYRGMTCYELDNLSKEYLVHSNKNLDFSYLTGELVQPHENCDINNSLLRTSGCYSAGEYDTLNKDIDELESCGLSAYQWDWLSNNYVA